MAEPEQDERAKRFQEKVRRELASNSGASARYSQQVREEAVAYARDALREGASRAQVAAVLNLCPTTLYRWLYQIPENPHASEVMAAQAGARSPTLSLVTPDGFRVEGLTLIEVPILLGELR